MNDIKLKAKLFDKIFNHLVKESCLNEAEKVDGCVEFYAYESFRDDGKYYLSYELHGDGYFNNFEISIEEYEFLSKLIKEIEDKEKEN